MPQRIDRIGQRTGRLLVIGPAKQGNGRNKRLYWFCECDCGNTVWVQAENLRTGHTISCGCYRREIQKKGCEIIAELRKTGWTPATTHGMTGTKVHTAWMHIKARCHQPSDNSFKFYGARGITMSDEWRKSFAAFYAYIGDPPSHAHSIDRMDNTKGYMPGNIRWATRLEQCNNRRNSVRYNGLSIIELSHKYQVHYERLKYLLRQRKLSLEEALHECGVPLYQVPV